MSGWHTIQRIKRVEQLIDELGFKFSKGHSGEFDNLSLLPKDADALPMYSRDAELFVGSIERLEDWLAGVQWAREYDRMCKISTDKTRAAAEQKERNRQLMQILKTGKKE